jgi:hypothetical protein
LGVYPQPSPRRISPALAAVLIVLAAVGGTGGYLVTRRGLADRGQISGNGPAGTGGPTGSGAPAVAPPTPRTTATTATPKASPVASSAPDATSCPALTEAAVRARGLAGGLQLLLYVSGKATDTTAGAEAWVCKNSDGLLIYQGHRRTGPFTDVCCTDTILLASGIRGRVTAVGDGFVATSPKDPTNPDDPNHTDYHVSRTTFYYIDLPQSAMVSYTIDRVGP